MSGSKNDMRTPLNRIRGLGSAREGTERIVGLLPEFHGRLGTRPGA